MYNLKILLLVFQLSNLEVTWCNKDSQWLFVALLKALLHDSAGFCGLGFTISFSFSKVTIFFFLVNFKLTLNNFKQVLNKIGFY